MRQTQLSVVSHKKYHLFEELLSIVKLSTIYTARTCCKRKHCRYAAVIFWLSTNNHPLTRISLPLIGDASLRIDNSGCYSRDLGIEKQPWSQTFVKAERIFALSESKSVALDTP